MIYLLVLYKRTVRYLLPDADLCGYWLGRANDVSKGVDWVLLGPNPLFLNMCVAAALVYVALAAKEIRHVSSLEVLPISNNRV